jgi:hypothetical protein
LKPKLKLREQICELSLFLYTLFVNCNAHFHDKKVCYRHSSNKRTLIRSKKNLFCDYVQITVLITFNTCHFLFYRIILDHGPQCYENQKQEPTTSA